MTPIGGAQAGTAYVDVVGDFTKLQAGLATVLGPAKMGTMGKVAGGALAAGIVAAGALKAAYDIGEAFDNSYDTIRVRTGATGKELGKLKTDFREVVKDVPTDFDSAGTAIAGLNQRLDLTGKPLQRITKQVLELTRITGGDLDTNVQSITRLFGDWSIKTGQQDETLDKLFRTTQETGIELTTLADYMVQFGSPLRQLDFDFDTTAAMFAKFEKEGVNIQTSMPGLRMALKNFAAEGRDPAQALGETIDKIEKAGSTAEANTIAFEVFGTRAGPDLAAAVREGRLDFDELIRSIDSGEDTIGKASRATMDFDEHWQRFKNNTLVALEPAATKVFEALGEAMKDVTDIIADPKLTGDEKFERLTELVVNGVTDMAVKVGEKAPAIGLALIKGSIKGVWEAGQDLADEFSEWSYNLGYDMGAAFVDAYNNTVGRIPAVDNIELGENKYDEKREVQEREKTRREEERRQRDHLGYQLKQSRVFSDRMLGIDRETTGKSGRLWTNLGDLLDDVVRRMNRDGRRESGKLARGVTGNVGEMVNTASDGLRTLGDNTNEALSAFEVDKVEFGIKVAKKTIGSIFKQRGGPIDVGAPLGDSVPAMLERGEYVLNRHATTAIGKDVLDKINFGKYARFQSGGYAGVSGDTDFVPALGQALSAMAKATGRSIYVQDGRRTMAEQQALYANYLAGGNLAAVPNAKAPHVRGIAGDITPGREVFGGVAGKFGLGFTVPSESWHIELLNAAAAGKMGAAAQKVARVILEGPGGMLKRGGQGALDTVWKGAEAFRAKQQPKLGVGTSFGPVPGGTGAELMRAIAKDRGWSFSDWWALDAAETSHGANLTNPSSTARLRGQFLDMNWGKYGPGSDPAQNPSMREQIISMASYIQDRYGNPTAAWNWHQAHNWYQRGGEVDFGGWFGKGGSITARRPTVIGIGDHGTETATITPDVGPAAAPEVKILARIFIGNREITDIARVEAERVVDEQDDFERQHARMSR